MKSTIKSAKIKQYKNNQFIVTISYDDGSGASKSFPTQALANEYLIQQEEDSMSKNDKKQDEDLNKQDMHVNAPGETHETPEKAASDMSIDEAEAINANVNAAPMPPDANVNTVNTEANNLDADSENGSGNTQAPHEMGVSDKPNNGQQIQNNV